MKGGTTASGYTIVEVMIFLAVTGVLFFIAMLSINGQQGKTEFAQGVRDFQGTVDNAIASVRNGDYPEVANISCTLNPGLPPTLATAGGGQGTNGNCIYFGKVIEFDTSDKAHVYTVAAQRASGGVEVQSFAEAHPTTNPGIGLKEDQQLNGGIRVSKVMAKKGGTFFGSISSIGFFHPFAAASSNSEEVVVAPLRTTVFGASNPVSTTQDLATNGDADRDPDVVVICLEQGGPSGKKASVVIGGPNGSKSGTQLHIDDTATYVPFVLGGAGAC